MKKIVSLSSLTSPGLPAGKLIRFVLRVVAAALLAVCASPHIYSQDLDSDPEAYKLRVAGQFWYATPIASIAGSSSEGQISFNRDFGFDEYSTFNAGLDWHFKRKHHLFFLVSPNQSSQEAVLQRTITFRDQTFEAGSSINAELRTYSFAPGTTSFIAHTGISGSSLRSTFSISKPPSRRSRYSPGK